MKNLSIAFLAAVSLVSFAGCKKKGGGGDYVAKMSEFRDQMCKCTDKACADKVSDSMSKMSKESGDKAAAISDDDAKKLEPINQEFAKCMTKAMMPAGGDKPADPAAAAPAAPAPPSGDKPADPAAAAGSGSAGSGSAAGSN